MSKVVTAPKEFFPTVKQIKYEGRDSKNPLAFRWYNANQKVAGKTMKDHLRFAVAYWHTICGNGTDMFGRATKDHFPWFKAPTCCKTPKTNSMPPLSLLPNWESPITVSTMWMLLPKAKPSPRWRRTCEPLLPMPNKSKKIAA